MFGSTRKLNQKSTGELMMLFTPWRSEETDLFGIFSLYKDHYMVLSNAIYDMNILEESYDSIAPSTQNIEQQDLAEGSKDLHPDFNENYNLSDVIGIASADSNTEPLILNELQDDDYRHMVQMLNKEQKEFFYHVLHLIKTSDKPFYCFLSGGAGVGKSHLTKALYQAALKIIL